MATIQVDILNPKAEKLLRDLADLKLISIKETGENAFLSAVRRIRKKAEPSGLSIDDITEEVEDVRINRYARKGQ